ncbi:hypothetical protein ACQPX6_25125 [Actinomycetospora sp. CA-101289]|uniref:hypothetical protein n=1 Tax=Actinomycetospora sp. CA-101289 TaxID=3239893 RepID=UPI003D965996
MDERRWGFAGLSDAEYEELERAGPRGRARRRQDEVVDVALDPAGEVVCVSLADDWRARVDPGRLGSEVVAAHGRAVGQVLAANLDLEAPTEPSGPPDLTPWNGSFRRLLAEASQDLARFSAATSALAGRVLTRTSAGRHVTGTARYGVVTEVTVDAAWARGASVPEVERELFDVLAGLRRDLVPEGVRHGPAHPASVALGQLAADPALVTRLAGMTP